MSDHNTTTSTSTSVSFSANQYDYILSSPPTTCSNQIKPVRKVLHCKELVRYILEFAPVTLKELIPLSLVSRGWRSAIRGCQIELYFPRTSNDVVLRSLGSLQMHRMQMLDLSGCCEITDLGLEHLKQLTNLTSLDLDSC